MCSWRVWVGTDRTLSDRDERPGSTTIHLPRDKRTLSGVALVPADTRRKRQGSGVRVLSGPSYHLIPDDGPVEGLVLSPRGDGVLLPRDPGTKPGLNEKEKPHLCLVSHVVRGGSTGYPTEEGQGFGLFPT